MSNPFTGKKENPIPRNLNECMKPNPTATELHNWSERIENLGHIFFVLIIIIGAISTLFGSFLILEDAATIIGTMIGSAITWTIYACIEYFLYHILVLVLRSLATITQNSSVTTNISLLEASLNPSIPAAPEVPEQPAEENAASENPLFQETWTCASCGYVNRGNHSYCVQCNVTKAWSQAQKGK